MLFVLASAAKVSCSELATSTDDSTVNRQTPVSIRFTPSLTYAEKLLLKKSRRMELPTSEDLVTSRSCDSVLELGRHTLRDSHLDSPAGCHVNALNELSLNHSNSNQGMCFSM